jgi:multiple sugar transport system permease protein
MSDELAAPTGVVEKPRTKTKAFKPRERNENWAFVAFVGPLILGLVIFVFIPITWGFIISFFQARVTFAPVGFVGLDNYTNLLNDPEFTRSLGTVIVFAIFIVPITVLGSLMLAVLVNSIKLGKGFFRSAFFIPTACSYVVASLIWRMSIFNGLAYGPANQILINVFNANKVAWIGPVNPPLYWVVIVTARLWLQLGFFMIILLAGLQEIPKELYEAARVDGAATGWQTFRNITLPGLRNALISVLLLNLIMAFQAFDEFYNILKGPTPTSGNLNAARTPLIYLYQTAFGSHDFGKGAAGGFILSVIIIVFTIVQGRLLGFGRHDAS